MVKYIFLPIYLIAAASFLQADDSFTIYWENDGTFAKPNGRTDRHYTNGIKMVYTAQPDWQWLKNFGKWHFGNGGEDIATAVGFFLGQDMFTPDRIGYPNRRKPRDRVFAGWLHSGIFLQRANSKVLDHFEIDLGVIGPAAQADETQRWIHYYFNAPQPVGWENQLSDELSFDASWRRRMIADWGPFRRTKYTDFLPELAITLGSAHRHLEAGLIFRCGLNLPHDFGPARLTFPRAVLLDSTNGQYRQWAYFFVRIAGRYVQYNRFLSGLSTEPFTGRIQFGIVYRYRSLQLGYSQTYMTREFKQQTANDSFGSLTLGISF